MIPVKGQLLSTMARIQLSSWGGGKGAAASLALGLPAVVPGGMLSWWDDAQLCSTCSGLSRNWAGALKYQMLEFVLFSFCKYREADTCIRSM